MELKDKAVTLKQEGRTYKQISEELGVSVDWCKRNLKGVTKTANTNECVQEIIALGTRPQGVTEYEANGVVFKYYDNASKDKLRYMKNKAKENPNCLIHSGWIDHMNPNQSHKAINAFALHLLNELEVAVDHYLELYPNSNRWSVRYEILKLSFPKISQEPLAGRVMKNEVLAELMEERD